MNKLPCGSARTEWEFLRRCARTRLDAEDRERIQGLAGGGIDNSSLMAAAERHGVAPLLYHALSSLPGTAPDAFLRRLQAYAAVNAELNCRHTRELVSILELLRRHGIEALPFKGAVLALSVYGSLALRKAGDNDILLAKEEAAPAGTILLGHGYRYCGASPREIPRSRFGPFELRMRRSGGEGVVELRWKLTPCLFPDLDPGLMRRQSVAFMGDRIPTPAPEETLVLLCIHGSKHEWSRLMWICDVAELLGAFPALDWRRVREHAERVRLWRAVRLGLALARDVLDAGIPPDIAEEIAADSLVRRLAARVCSCLPGEIAGSNPGRAIFDPQVLNSFVNRQRWRLYRWGRLLAPTERDREIVRIPEPLSWLYWAVRPVRVAVERGTRPLRARCAGVSPPGSRGCAR